MDECVLLKCQSRVGQLRYILALPFKATKQQEDITQNVKIAVLSKGTGRLQNTATVKVRCSQRSFSVLNYYCYFSVALTQKGPELLRELTEWLGKRGNIIHHT